MIPNGSGDTIGKTGIGTGPFMVDKFDAEGTTILKANQIIGKEHLSSLRYT